MLVAACPTTKYSKIHLKRSKGLGIQPYLNAVIIISNSWEIREEFNWLKNSIQKIQKNIQPKTFTIKAYTD